MFALLVDDYDRAIYFLTNALKFRIIEDKAIGDGKRWVIVESGQGLRILIAKAKNEKQKEGLGKQFFGRVGIFLYTSTFDEDYKNMKDFGVNFQEEIRNEEYGRVVVFKDYLGNKWDLIERKR